MRLQGMTNSMVAKIAQEVDLGQDTTPDVQTEAKAIWEEMMDLADDRLQAILSEDEAFGTALYKFFQDTYVKEQDTYLGI